MGAPLRVAVVGSGPAGFYAADALLKSEEPTVAVDMIDRLPTPWGLVRLGVAPDHENIKAVSRAFERIAQKPGFRFFGNVEVGRTVMHAELLSLYDAVLYSVGAQTDRRMGIPGEDLPGSWPATAFVAWYNGHPDFQELGIELNHKRAVVVGNGNVAIDVARMLALTPEELATTDTVDAAAQAIIDSPLEEIVLLGRRGPVQAAFTPPELQELGELAGADVAVDPADLVDAASERALEEDRERARRNVELLHEYAAREPAGKPRTIRLRFLTSPVALLGTDRVEGVEVVRNELVEENGRIVARPVGEHETIEAGLVFRSVGYQGVELPGVPFDAARATIPNTNGRVVGSDRTYCAGWIKRGPSGVIGTNKKDATETVEELLADARAGKLQHRAEGSLEALLDARGAQYIEYPGWQAIDAAERAAGAPLGRPRVKLVSWDQLLASGR